MTDTIKRRSLSRHTHHKGTITDRDRHRSRGISDVGQAFLIELAFYLHLQSSSGLMDGFDMKQLCCLTSQQQNLSNNREELRNYAEDAISLLGPNTGILSERGCTSIWFFTFIISRIFCRIESHQCERFFC